MGVNFREALATLSRALPVVLFRAGIFVAGGFMVIIIFGMLLFALRLAGSANQGVVIVVAVTVVLGWLVSGLVLQRFFFYRYRAAMLLLFSGRSLPVSGLAAVIREAGRFFPNYSRWAVVNRGLRRALSALTRAVENIPNFRSRLPTGVFLEPLTCWPKGKLAKPF
jgi:hypothetical protein